MSVHVRRVEKIDSGESCRVDVDEEGNSVVWMLEDLITDEGAEVLGPALDANRAYYDRRTIPRQLASQSAAMRCAGRPSRA